MIESHSTEFAVQTSESDAYLEVLFSHSGSPASGTQAHWGQIIDGRARRGDGVVLGDVNRSIRIAMFDQARIDPTTVNSDLSVTARQGTRHGLFVTWQEGGSLRASGLMLESTPTGYVLDPALEGEAAVEAMKEANMLRGDAHSLDPLSASDGPPTFSAITVSGYRGFAEPRTLSLAAPNGRRGSGLTILVGANNSGKSTFLEAIDAVARARQQTTLSFSQPRRHREQDAVSIELQRNDGRSLKVSSVRSGSSQAGAEWLPEGAGPTKFDVHVTPSRRQFSPYFGSSGTTGRNWGVTGQEFSRTELREQFVGRLRKVDQEEDARAVFDALLQRITGETLKWTIDELGAGQQFLKLIESDGAWHTSEGMGDGLVSLLFIVDALYDSEPGSLIVIDEPELSLHPQLVRRLGSVVSEFAADRQILIATHSPLLLDWSDVANGATVARVFKSRGRSELAQASVQTLRKVAKLASDRNVRTPHTVGQVAREALFLEDGVILTEGQDDVVFLPRALEDLGLSPVPNLYGWGSGGVGNVPTIAKLFVELGFSKIGAILDDDGTPGTAAALSKLNDMAPTVLVRQIPAPDIRYKEASAPHAEVLGLLDSDNTHVRKELRDDATRVLAEVLAHVTKGGTETPDGPFSA